MAVDLHLDWCSHKAAKFAVEHWHYSKRMPKSKLAKIGVWEDGLFIGCVIYGVGAGNSTNGKRFGLSEKAEMAELVRVALSRHITPTSKIIAISIKIIKKAFSKIRILNSFADTKQGHLGIIYQATGWFYMGAKSYNDLFIIHGKPIHTRTLYDRKWKQQLKWLREHIDPKAEKPTTPPKHRYLYPLDKEMRRRIMPLAKPYPKRPASIGSDASGFQPEEGGASPTAGL